MVRLKDQEQISNKVLELYFNSNMVRLKAGDNTLLTKTNNNFNSNMVRLKVEKLQEYTIFVKGFQFQYGAIKSCYGCI